MAVLSESDFHDLWRSGAVCVVVLCCVWVRRPISMVRCSVVVLCCFMLCGSGVPCARSGTVRGFGVPCSRIRACASDAHARRFAVRQVQRIVESYHGAVGANIGVQDGKDAGQSVPHVHVHILPR